jgi:peptidoglycan/LPS O-acetylase OafA/YrhL
MKPQKIQNVSEYNSPITFTQPLKNLQLEGLRGLAALWVLGLHIVQWEPFSPNGKMLSPFVADVVAPLTPGHLGVLFFFILSGYVMGVVYPYDKEFSWKQYLIKRWVRIWPMYALTVTISCMLIPVKPWQFLGNLLFLNSYIPACPVLWSVKYELGFYLTLPLILSIRFLYKNKALPLLLLGVLITLISYIFSTKDLHPFFTWINGLSLWLIGLFIAWQTQPKKSDFTKIYFYAILPHTFITMALFSVMGAFKAISQANGMPNFGPHFAPTISDFLYLPSILCVFLELVKVRLSKQLEFTSFFFSFTLILLALIPSIVKGTFWIMPNYVASLLAITALVLKIKPVSFDVAILAPIGAISYGIYIYHMPAMLLIARLPSLGDSWIEWCTRLTASILLILGFSYLIEIKIQPKIRHFLLNTFVFK